MLFIFQFSQMGNAIVLQVWHAYRGREKIALEHIVQSYNLSHETQIQLLAVPFDAYSAKLRATIPLGNGPDFFIAGSSAISSFARDGLILPLESYLPTNALTGMEEVARRSVEVLYPGAVWGLPLNLKTLVLFYQKDMIKKPPRNTDELFRLASNFTRPNQGVSGKWGLVYELDNFYYHAAWFHVFGGHILKQGSQSAEGVIRWIPQIDSPAFLKSALYVYHHIVQAGLAPQNPSRYDITHLFNTGNALFVINGQWFRGEVDSRVHYGVATLPVVSELQKPMQPYLTVECYLLSAYSHNQGLCVSAMRYLASPAMAQVMMRESGQTPVWKQAWEQADEQEIKIQKVFQAQAATAVPVPNLSEMAAVWGTGGALGSILNGKEPSKAIREGQARVEKEIETFR